MSWMNAWPGMTTDAIRSVRRPRLACVRRMGDSDAADGVAFGRLAGTIKAFSRKHLARRPKWRLRCLPEAIFDAPWMNFGRRGWVVGESSACSNRSDLVRCRCLSWCSGFENRAVASTRCHFDNVSPGQRLFNMSDRWSMNSPSHDTIFGPRRTDRSSTLNPSRPSYP